jgi:mannose-1-phosphate guanylyltransferase
LTRHLPKPLLPVGDQPVLAHIVARLAASGIDRMVANLHYMPPRFMSVINRLPVELKVIVESVIRGTAGGVAGARHLLGAGPIIVHNGDILARPQIDLLTRGALSQGICLEVAPRAVGQGSVGTGVDGRVVRLRGECFGEETAGGDYIGVAGLGPEVVASLPDTGCLIGDVALPRLRRGAPIGFVAHSAAWVDIGDPANYLRANLRWLLERRSANSWIGRDAVVEAGIAVTDCVIGDGAVVGGRGTLARCVVWPGAHAHAPLCDAVVTGQGDIVQVGRGPLQV